MNVVLDLILSMLLGGMILMIVMTANDIAVDNHSVLNGDMLVQEMLITTANIVEGELRNMGFGVPENRSAVLTADSSTIRFISATNPSASVVDTITYSLGDTTELHRTQNELDRFLKRRVGGGPNDPIGVVTTFRLRYFTPAGEELSTPVPTARLNEIHVVEVTMEVQNPYALARWPGVIPAGERAHLYSSSLWQQTRLASQNSRR
jgi:hypothetical protein